MTRKKDAQTPAGTTKGGGVYPLAPTLPYIQEVTPVTIVSAIDDKGQQQPYQIAPDTGIFDAYELQGGSKQEIANGATLRSDPIDMSQFDSLIFYIACNLPTVAGNEEIDLVSLGNLTADDGTQLNLRGSSAPDGLQSKIAGVDAVFVDTLNDPSQTVGTGDNYYQYKVSGLHGMYVGISLKNNGDTASFGVYARKVAFRGT